MNKKEQQRFQSLYRKHLSALKRQGVSQATIDAYSLAIRRITKYFDRCPDTITIEDLEEYFSELLKTHSWSTIKRDRCGLQFFYKHVLKKQWHWVDIIKPPKVHSLPDILTLDEIQLLINTAHSLRHQTFILTTYSMGMRISETLKLRIGDIDAKRMKVHIREAKGLKDRYVTLPQDTLIALRRYWATHHNPKLIFPAGATNKMRHQATIHMDRGGMQKALQVILADAGIHKRITFHSLRHCYGAHLNEAGVSLRTIQKEMGHDCPKTTALYTQLTQSAQKQDADVINDIINHIVID